MEESNQRQKRTFKQSACDTSIYITLKLSVWNGLYYLQRLYKKDKYLTVEQ